jgi:glycerol-3-phosphate O-acyltransferase/dihydroxyacetone phosphate acyltransferase
MIYIGLKFIIKLALNVFFRTLSIKYAESIPDDKPLIIVANHPSTSMDAMVIAATIKQPLYFLAKGSLFTNRFSQMLFNLIHMIPIYRRQDDPAMMARNKDMFERCYHFLSKRKALLIFPEGISKRDRRLHKIKTGTARIALGAEKSNNYQLGLVIVPVGINYSDVGIFRSDLFLSFDRPIDVFRFFDLHREDEQKAVNGLTDHIRERLEEHMINIETEEMNTLVEQIEVIYKSKLSDDLGLSLKDKIEDFRITKGIVEAIRYFSEYDPLRVEMLRGKITQYAGNLDRFHLKDEQFKSDVFRGSLSSDSFKNALFVLFGLPVYLYGIAANYPPYKLTGMLSGKISDAIEHQGPVKLILGIVLFPAYYIFLLWYMSSICLSGWFTMPLAITFPLSGFFALHYWDRLEKMHGFYATFSLFYRQNTLVAALVQQRMDIMNILKTAQEDYVKYTEDSNEI